LSTLVNYAGNSIENISSCEQEECVLPYLNNEHISSFRSIFGFLNDKDRDILYLIFVSRKKQKDVQSILQRSQPSLCYDIKRIRLRLRYIFYIHSVADEYIEFLKIADRYFTQEEIEVMTVMFYTSSYTVASDVVKKSQVKVRYIFFRCLDRMIELGKSGVDIWNMYEIMSQVLDNLNVIKRTYKGKGRLVGRLGRKCVCETV
jgi:hypothetical protein